MEQVRKKKVSDEMIAYVRELRGQGKKWKETAAALNEKYGTQFKESSLWRFGDPAVRGHGQRKGKDARKKKPVSDILKDYDPSRKQKIDPLDHNLDELTEQVQARIDDLHRLYAEAMLKIIDNLESTISQMSVCKK